MAADNNVAGGITVRTAFSAPVYGLKFNVSDLDHGGEFVEIRVYDGSGTLIPPGGVTVRTQAAFVLDENLTSMSYGTLVQTATALNGGVAFSNLTDSIATSNAAAIFVQVAYTQAISAFEVDVSGVDSSGIWITAPYFNLPCMTKTFLPGTFDTRSETSSLKIQLDNAIDGLLHNVAFTDTLPDGLVLNAAPSAQCGGTVTGTIGGSTLAFTGAQLGPSQQTCTISATVRATRSGTKVNDRSRISGVTGLDRSGMHATVIATEPVLVLNKTATPTSVLVNGTITYSLQYENRGNSVAHNVLLVDPIPPGAIYVNSTNSGVFATDNVTWTLGDLAAGAKGTVSVVVTAPGLPLTLNNLAILTADNAVDAQNSAAVNVTGEPAFSLRIIDTPDPVLDGTDLHYTLALTNTGTVPATGTTLTMPVPADTTFVSATGGGTLAGGIITWNIGPLDVGKPWSVVVTVHVNAPLLDGTLLDASATADAGNLAAPVVATAQTTVTSEPVLDVTLTATPANVQGGDHITYTLVFTNTGTALAAGTILTLTIPGSTVITASGTSTVAGSLVSWTIGNLLVGQSGSHSVTVRVDTGVPNGTVLTAVASLTSSTTCGTAAVACADTDDAIAVVGTASVLELTKTALPYVSPGSSLTYELSYANTGNLDAQNIIVSDVLPSGGLGSRYPESRRQRDRASDGRGRNFTRGRHSDRQHGKPRKHRYQYQ
jgi:uncharacterized repeat protein (TIGR01451 family)